MHASLVLGDSIRTFRQRPGATKHACVLGHALSDTVKTIVRAEKLQENDHTTHL